MTVFIYFLFFNVSFLRFLMVFVVAVAAALFFLLHFIYYLLLARRNLSTAVYLYALLQLHALIAHKPLKAC